MRVREREREREKKRERKKEREKERKKEREISHVVNGKSNISSFAFSEALGLFIFHSIHMKNCTTTYKQHERRRQNDIHTY